MLNLDYVQLRHGGRLVLDLPHLAINPAELTVIVGHRGSGRSCLLQLLAGRRHADRGGIALDGRPLPVRRGRILALASPSLPPRVARCVREQVRCGGGRWWRRLWAGSLPATDPEPLLERCGLAHLAGCRCDRLAASERQRLWIAMQLAAPARLLLLDEPGDTLCPVLCGRLLTLLARRRHETGQGALVVLDDPGLALRHADRIVALCAGRVHFDGLPSELRYPGQLAALVEPPAARARPERVALPRAVGLPVPG